MHFWGARSAFPSDGVSDFLPAPSQPTSADHARGLFDPTATFHSRDHSNGIGDRQDIPFAVALAVLWATSLLHSIFPRTSLKQRNFQLPSVHLLTRATTLPYYNVFVALDRCTHDSPNIKSSLGVRLGDKHAEKRAAGCASLPLTEPYPDRQP